MVRLMSRLNICMHAGQAKFINEGDVYFCFYDLDSACFQHNGVLIATWRAISYQGVESAGDSSKNGTVTL